jgi:uncharacterized membrane protein
LILLEVTVVRFGWFLNFDYHLLFAGVIWMIGACMLLTTPVIGLGTRITGVLGSLIVFGHDLLLPIEPASLGPFSWLWVFVHEGGGVELGGGVQVAVLFSLLPWLGVLWLGIVFEPLLEQPDRRRRRSIQLLGGCLTAAFLALRLPGAYGNPTSWDAQSTPWMTVVAILNTNKYPASLQFLLMTLGPAIALLPLLESRSKVVDWLGVFGRVPLFYYVLHLTLIHGLAAGFSLVRHGKVIDWLKLNWAPEGLPEGYGYGLVWIYVIWMLVVAILYPPCTRFAELKKRSSSPFLKYL